ncbi:MAG: type I methionyl aminopeptidase [Armatimonadetes bacterium]|nr:type I methionyl aminopeptidase [Candidatus Hippobium faecium]
MIIRKSDRDIEKMKIAGRVCYDVLEEVGNKIKEGMSTLEVDEICKRVCIQDDAIPAFKGLYGFKYSACVSVNDEVIHGIPSSKRILKNGDLVSVDFGAIKQGFNGDSTRTYIVGGKSSKIGEDLCRVTREALYAGIDKCVIGNRLGDVSNTIQQYCESRGFYIVKEYVGHGIGKNIHEDPNVPNYGRKGTGVRLCEGLALAIEPMVNAGTARIELLPDNWTVVTEDGSLAAHWEHTVIITADGPIITTDI